MDEELYQGHPAHFEVLETPVIFESQEAYLDRLGLLKGKEKSLLGNDWNPEETILKEIP